MYEPVKFKRLQELASELQEKLHALSGGKLSAAELEHMTEHSRELYERLVVLRFKAFAEEVNPVEAPSTEAVQEELPATPAISFKIDEPKVDIAPNQVSLIDAIEEVTKEESIAETTPVAETISTPEVAMEAPVSMPPRVAQPQATGFPESLNDQYVRGMGIKETLADKLEHNPISDLKKAITLNQRFQFSRELFKGNNQEYEVAVDKLNTTGREDAMRHLDTLKSKYSWNNESAVTTDFISLVERRHQH